MNTFFAGGKTALGIARFVCAGLIALPASAQTMKPGLWEINNQMGGSGDSGAKMAAAMKQAQQQMASMSPEQRKMMEAMMARQGINMRPGGNGDMSVRVCISKEMAARNEAPASSQGDCKREAMQRSGNTTTFKFTCTNPPSSGEGRVTLHNPESYTMNMTFMRSGQQGQMTMDAKGKWLANDCGNVKPRKD